MDKFKYLENDFKEIEVDGKTIKAYRIQALQDFENLGTKGNSSHGILVKKGELGGYVKKGALAQNGSCWVDEDSVVVPSTNCVCVFDDAFVSCSTVVGNFLVRENAKLAYAKILSDKGNFSEFLGNSLVGNETESVGSLKASGDVNVSKCKISGSVEILGNSQLQNCVIKGKGLGDRLTINLNSDNYLNKFINDQTITESVILDNSKYHKKRKSNLFNTIRYM